MLICNVGANYQFATLQSCLIIRSRLNFFRVLVPASDVWLLFNRGCFASVFFITSCAGDIELLDLPHADSHLTLAHVKMEMWSPPGSTTSTLAAIFFCPMEKKRGRCDKKNKTQRGKCSTERQSSVWSNTEMIMLQRSCIVFIISGVGLWVLTFFFSICALRHLDNLPLNSPSLS